MIYTDRERMDRGVNAPDYEEQKNSCLRPEGFEQQMEEDTMEKMKKLFPSGDISTSDQARKPGIASCGHPHGGYREEEGSANFEQSKSMSEEKKLELLGKLGNRFNQGKLPWHLVDFKALEPMVKVLEYGAKKYAVDQWKNGLSKKDIMDCLLRHVFAILSGEEKDVESGELHIGHVFCNALFYSYFTTVNEEKARP